jgi:hypothetical protein
MNDEIQKAIIEAGIKEYHKRVAEGYVAEQKSVDYTAVHAAEYAPAKGRKAFGQRSSLVRY